MGDCEIDDWKLQALQGKAFVLCWHPVLEVGAHQYQSCSSSVSWLACEVAFGDVGSSVNESAACLVETECSAWVEVFG